MDVISIFAAFVLGSMSGALGQDRAAAPDECFVDMGGYNNFSDFALENAALCGYPAKDAGGNEGRVNHVKGVGFGRNQGSQGGQPEGQPEG